LRQTRFNTSGSWQRIDFPKADIQLWHHWLDDGEAEAICADLMQTLDWQQPSLTIAGRTHKIPRLKAWHGDPAAHYRYSGQSFSPSPWTDTLRQLKARVEEACAAQFNSVLANWYRSGQDSMGFHADNERELGAEPVIASLSLGATRRFVFQPSGELKAQANQLRSLGLELESGDLLLMRGSTQRYWKHGIPKTQKLVGDRINLTFRYIFR